MKQRLPADPALWATLILQAALCLPGMSDRSLFLDEAYSAVMARRSLSAIHAALVHDAGPPLYYDLLHFWRGVAGESALGLRALSLLFALGATVLLYRLALILFDRETARLSALLWAVHPLMAFYAGEARNYALFAFLALVLLSAIYNLSADRRPLRYLAMGSALTALAYTHNFGWFAGAAALLAGLAIHRRAILDRRLALALLVAVAAYLPWVPTLRQQLGNSERTIWWMRAFWSPWSPLQSLGAFAPFGRRAAFIDLPAAPEGWWPVVTLLWLLPAAAVFLRKEQGAKRRACFLWVYLCLGLAIPTVWSAMHEPVVLPGRTDFFLLPVFVLLVGAGLAAAPQRLRSAWAGVLLFCAAAASMGRLRQVRAHEEREWVEILQREARPGDVVVCTNLTRPAAEYYLRGAGLALLSYPRDMAEELAHYNPEWYERNLDAASDATAVVSEAMSRLGAGRRLWVIASRHAINGALLGELARQRDLIPEPVLWSPRMGLQRIEMEVAILPFSRVAAGISRGRGQ